ncbi:MAG TPA: ORF6N domain-containing protein [Bacteroidales bacterium]|nr:ORF6N domain-containing protein [Bacteroidales bacterium]
MNLQPIQNKIYEIRGHKVMFDYDLAEMYQIETKNLNLAVKRNIIRFPEDFMFQLTKSEWETLRLQIETSKNTEKKHEILRLRNETTEKRGGRRYLPYAFTEHGVAMLASVLKSEKAALVNIAIVRAFIALKQFALTHKELTEKLKELENKYNKQFKDVYEALNYTSTGHKLRFIQYVIISLIYTYVVLEVQFMPAQYIPAAKRQTTIRA